MTIEDFATPARQYRWRIENGYAVRGHAVNIRQLKCERCGDRPDPTLVSRGLTLCMRCLSLYSAKVRELKAAQLGDIQAD
jgi:hypothetical protein